jgi:hypothetical protein
MLNFMRLLWCMYCFVCLTIENVQLSLLLHIDSFFHRFSFFYSIYFEHPLCVYFSPFMYDDYPTLACTNECQQQTENENVIFSASVR